jgi:hypothetical protein
MTAMAPVLTFEDRPSDAPGVERIWRSRSDRGGPFVSIAESRFEMAITRLQGRTCLTLRGPETKATPAECPAEGEWLGIRFAHGTFMPALTPGAVLDRRDATLPDASARAFWLDGSAWEYPTFENADTFVARLLQRGILVRDPIVQAMLRGDVDPRSIRTAQRHVLRATGLPSRAIAQIERARLATQLLRAGRSILDVIHEAGYYDQAHLTRSLTHRIGQTPAAVARGQEQLSFLYKTTPSR